MAPRKPRKPSQNRRNLEPDCFEHLVCGQCKKSFYINRFLKHLPCGSVEKFFQHRADLPQTVDELEKRFRIRFFSAKCLFCGFIFSDIKSAREHKPLRCRKLMAYVKNVRLKSPEEEKALKRSCCVRLLRMEDFPTGSGARMVTNASGVESVSVTEDAYPASHQGPSPSKAVQTLQPTVPKRRIRKNKHGVWCFVKVK